MELLDLLRTTLDHDAPCLVGLRVEAVDFEGDAGAEDRTRQLRSLRGSEHDCAVIDHVVDREDVRVVGDRDREPPDDTSAKERPALVRIEDVHSVQPVLGHGVAPSASSIVTWTTPSLNSDLTGRPASWKTWSILVLCGIVSATNKAMCAPRARAANARNMAVPSP